MSLIVKPHGDFQPNTNAESAKVNDQINTIYADHNGGINNANIDALAAIAKSKIDLTGQIVNGDISATAAIAQSKLALTIEGGGGIAGTDLRVNTGTGLVGGGPIGGNMTISQVPDSVRQLASFQWNDGLFGTKPVLDIVQGDGINVAGEDAAWGVRLVINNLLFYADSIPVTNLKKTTGSASGTITPSQRIDVNLNLYTVSKNINSAAHSITGKTPTICCAYTDGGVGTTERFSLFNDTSESLAYNISWSYLTASKPPEVLLLADKDTNEVLAVWQSQLDDPNREPLSYFQRETRIIKVKEMPDQLKDHDRPLDGDKASTIMKMLKSGELTIANEELVLI